MKEIVSYVQGCFNDFKGKEHQVIVCGVTTRYPKYETPEIIQYGENDWEEATWAVSKSLRIGVAICNPIDEFDLDKGHSMAYGRAMADDCIYLASSRPGMFNTKTVNCILNNYLDFIKRDPGSIIKGYNESEKRYHEKIDLLDDIKNMNQQDIDFIKLLAHVTPENIEYAKKVCKLL